MSSELFSNHTGGIEARPVAAYVPNLTRKRSAAIGRLPSQSSVLAPRFT